MRALFKTLIFTVLIAIGGRLSADKEPEYIKYVDEITADFVKEMQKKHNLEAYKKGSLTLHLLRLYTS